MAKILCTVARCGFDVGSRDGPIDGWMVVLTSGSPELEGLEGGGSRDRQRRRFSLPSHANVQRASGTRLAARDVSGKRAVCEFATEDERSWMIEA